MSNSSVVLLDQPQIQFKISRIAYQIYEDHTDVPSVIIAGIIGNGYTLAKRIKTVLDEISDLEVILCKLSLNKTAPLDGNITTDISQDIYQNQSVILVDDVLNSGSTLVYGVKHFLEVPLRSLKTAVLANRNHKKFPVKADYKGLSVSTTLQEHITVVFDQVQGDRISLA